MGIKFRPEEKSESYVGFSKASDKLPLSYLRCDQNV